MCDWGESESESENERERERERGARVEKLQERVIATTAKKAHART